MDEEILKQNVDSFDVRDTFKSKDYYINKLSEITQNISNLKEQFDNGKFIWDSGYYSMMEDYLFKKISILYVLNASFDEIKQNVEEYFEIINNLSKVDKLQYTYIVNLLSLGYVYNFDAEKFEFLKSNMIDENYVDAVLDLLKNKIFYNKSSTTKDFYFKEKGNSVWISSFMFSVNSKYKYSNFNDEYDKDSKGLMNVINANDLDNKNEEFLNFLNNVKSEYYNRLLKLYENIYENKYIYTGSFDFKLTAIAKILGIDKNLLMDSKFIAVDLI